jgi:hypothetical protein
MSAASTISKTIAMAALAVMASACGGGDSTTSATAPTVTTGTSTVLFEGKLAVGGSAFYSFTVTTAGNADVMLASVTSTTSPGSESNVVLGLALGTPLGTDCTITSSLPASAALQSPLVNNLTPGIYCARVYDIGNLKVPVNFAIRIVHT